MNTENSSDIYKSRTQIKKESEELQKLGERLTKLSPGQLKNIDLSDELRTAITDARQISARKAALRNRQFIGALMRHCDPDPIREALNRLDAGLSLTTKPQKISPAVATWVEAILESDDGVESFLAEYPSGDRQRVRMLKRNALKKRSSAPTGKEIKALTACVQEVIAQS
ncbi:ribosome biogenesis factor YjgA [Desulfoluna sp.]|uniref:ribosome biogenesis factor YjgA n=1 Tax=Desulfoluna sp. TaxID=2045199 RepID=UPI0026355407|nr:ribosome biogenesis factor YjgA [Desulfoluna sp.]